MRRLEEIFWVLFFFFLPTQFGKHFWPDWSYIHGLRIDYLSPAISVPLLITAVLVIMNIGYIVDFWRRLPPAVPFTIVAIVSLNTINSVRPEVSLWVWLRTLLYAHLVLVIARHRDVLTKLALYPLLIATLTQLLLVVLQLNQKSALQGGWYLLGERAVFLSLPDVAKVVIDGVEFMRPYGTFSHPNSLGGFYACLSFVLMGISVTRTAHHIARLTAVIAATLLVFLSFSQTAILAYILVHIFAVWHDKRYQFCRACRIARPLLFLVLGALFLRYRVPGESLVLRVDLFQRVIMVVRDNPLFGVGIGAYTVAQAKLSGAVSFLYQPVHSIYALALAEIGILGVGVVSWLVRKLKQVGYRVRDWYPLAIIGITGLADHYWLTLPQNLTLLCIVVALSCVKNSKTVQKMLPEYSQIL